jgi:type III secretion protein U
MQKNDTEQKTLPASAKKLRDARKKGRVSSSRDLISGISLLAVLIYLLLTWQTIRDRVLMLLDLVARIYLEPFNTAWRMTLSVALDVVWVTIVPAVAVLVITSVVVGMIGTFGPVFSFDPIKPNMEHINPAAGFKRIFSIRNVVEFAKSLVKVVVLASVLFLVLRFWLQAMFHAPNCGEPCVVPLLIAASKPIIAVTAIAFILIGLADVGVQRWLFLRDMRMTRTEYKRERKDLEGDPLILSARRHERQLQSTAPQLGLLAANLVIAGDNDIVGLRYSSTDTPVPLIVVRSHGDDVDTIRKTAAEANIVIADDPGLANAIVTKQRLGEYLHGDYFPDVARLLVYYGIASP